MTLVQVLLDARSVHMSCDFRLTDPRTGATMQDDAHKLVGALRFNWQAIIGVTGLGRLGGEPIADFILKAIERVPVNGTPEDLLDELGTVAEALESVPQAFRRHSFVVAFSTNSDCSLSIVSNFETFRRSELIRLPDLLPEMRSSSVRAHSPRYISTGAIGYVSIQEQRHLRRLVRSGAEDTVIQRGLAATNSQVSARSPTVSEGCNTGSMHVGGRGSRQPFLTPQQSGEFFLPESAEVFKMLRDSENSPFSPDTNYRVEAQTSFLYSPSPEYFSTQFRDSPDDPMIWNQYGVWHLDKGRYEEAREAFRRALELTPDFEVACTNLAGLEWRFFGEHGEAFALYSHSIALTEPEVPARVHTGFAELLASTGEAEKAESHYESAIALDDSDLGTLTSYAEFLGITPGRRSDAEAMFARLLEKSFQGAMPNLALGNCHLVWKQYELALGPLAIAVAGAPENPQANKLYGFALMRTGLAHDAVQYLKRAHKALPMDLHSQANYGQALILTGRFDSAKRHLRRALRSTPGDALLELNLATALWAEGRRQEAREVLRTTLERGTTDELAVEAIGLSLLVSDSADAGALASELLARASEGHTGDGYVIRHVARRIVRGQQLAEAVADVIEGVSLGEDLPSLLETR